MQERDQRVIIAELVDRIEQLEVDVRWLTAAMAAMREEQAGGDLEELRPE